MCRTEYIGVFYFVDTMIGRLIGLAERCIFWRSLLVFLFSSCYVSLHTVLPVANL